MKDKKSNLILGASLLGVFILWTVLILTVDVQAVGQNGTTVESKHGNEADGIF